jgi:serine-type D-Ala-D-Ala carboxypeptidase/endopeptidase (penicillin-binding protein 4)
MSRSDATTQVLNQIFAHPSLKHASIGVLIRSQETGKTLFAKNPDLALIPASNLKILTAIAVLQQKGMGFSFLTELYATPSKQTKEVGILGDVYLKGSGDPSLSTMRLETLVLTLKQQGVTQISGRLIADTTCFSGPLRGEGWEWDDEIYDYASSVSGLNCGENVVEVSVSVKEIALGGKYPLPADGFLSVKNTVQTVAGKGRNVVFDRAHGQNTLLLSGTIGESALPQTDFLTVEDPALFTLYRFATLCRTHGIALPETLTYEIAPLPLNRSNVQKRAQTRSEPLVTLVKTFLKDSNNLYGECFLRALTPKGDIASGEKSIVALLKRANIDTGGLNIADGSGLSRHNTVTARLLVDTLTKLPTLLSPPARQVFLAALPLGAVDGTLKNRFKGTRAAGKVRAKTGTLSGASSLSGYVTDKQGKSWVFAILLNHYDKEKGASLARQIQDSIVLAITK